MTVRTPRRGFTLFELVVVLAILLLLTAVVLPSASGLRSGPRLQGAADMISGELAVARSRAMEEGRPYRVSLSTDGTRIRRAPDDENFEQATAVGYPSPSAVTVDYPLDHVSGQLVADPTVNVPPAAAVNGWATIVTPQPDGTCLEDTALILLKEAVQTGQTSQGGMYVRVRGLTGSCRVVPNGSTR